MIIVVTLLKGILIVIPAPHKAGLALPIVLRVRPDVNVFTRQTRELITATTVNAIQ
jgi:hypothetical protein